MNDPTKVKIVPISSFIAVSIITIFSLYITNVIKTVPCGDTVLSSFYSNFLHIEPAHLIGNLTALYALSRVERAIGSKQFIALIVFLLIFNSIVEAIIHKRYPNIPCSVGFSGVLFGIMSWEMVTNNKFDAVTFLSIVMMVIAPSAQDSKASLSGHAVGATAGIIGGLMWTQFSKLV